MGTARANARPKMNAGIAAEYLDSQNVFVLRHPSHLPVLSPCDFQLFDLIKEKLAAQEYGSRSVLRTAVYECLLHIATEAYEMCFEQWRDRLRLCIQSAGEYFE